MAAKATIGASDNLFVGEDKSLVFTVVDTAGVAVNITGWTLSWTLKRRATDAAALITKTTGGGGIALTTPVSGICTVTIEDTDTDPLGPLSGVHELKRTNAGSEAVLSYGTLELKRALHAS